MPGDSPRILLIFLSAFFNCSFDKVRDYIFIEVDFLLADVENLTLDVVHYLVRGADNYIG